MAKEPAFNTILIPGAIINGNQQVSVCIELNMNHPQVNPGVKGDAENSTENWLTAVRKLPEMATALIQAAKDGKLFLANGQKLVPSPNQSVPSNRAAELWREFLGFSKDAGTTVQTRATLERIAKMSDILKLPVPEKLTLMASPVMKRSPEKAKELASDLRSVSDLTAHIKNHELIRSTIGTGLSPGTIEGIALAFNSEQAMHVRRFEKMATFAWKNQTGKQFMLYNKNVTDTLQKSDLIETESLNQAAVLLNFKAIFSMIRESPQFKEAAIDKLNNYLPFRKFVGNILEFEYPASSKQTELKLLSLGNQANSPGDNLIKSELGFKLATRVITHPQTGALLPAGIPGYENFFLLAVPKLKGNSKTISFETEGLKNNFAQAIRQINKDETHKYLNFTAEEDKKFTNIRKLTDLVNLDARMAFREYLIKQAKFKQIGIKLNNTSSNLHTKGQELFIINENWLRYNPNMPERADPEVLYEHDMIGGYVIYVKIKENGKVINDWTSINRIEEHFGKPTQSKKFNRLDLGLGTDAVVNAMGIDAEGTPTSTPGNIGINNGFLFNWTGQTISAQNPFRNQEQKDDDKKISLVEKVVALPAQLKESPLELSSLFISTKRLLEIDWFPYKQKHKGQYLLSRQFIAKKKGEKEKPLLQFGTNRTYQFLMVAQFLNGYAPINENQLRNGQAESLYSDCISKEENFLRHEHIRQLIISLDKDIYVLGTKQLKTDHLGESTNDLVIRKGEIISNDICVRYILPPEVPSFQIYNWYNFTRQDKFSRSRFLDADELYPFLERYQNKLEASLGKNSIYDGKISYLPDPIVNGFRATFFYDRACTNSASGNFPDQNCPFEAGSYIQPKPWKIILSKKSGKGGAYVEQNPHRQVLEIFLPEGRQVFIKLWPTYNRAHACFSPDLLQHQSFAPDVTAEMTFDELHTSPTVISFTHAVQRPIFKPLIEKMLFTRYKHGFPNSTPSTTSADATITFEHLDVWDGLPLNDSQPTGELELYALWNDYSSDKKGPQKSIAQKRRHNLPTKGFVFVGKIIFHDSKENKDLKMPKPRPTQIGEHVISCFSRTCIFDFEPSFNISYYTPSIFKVRNTSKFISYFENINEEAENLLDKEEFSLWSPEFITAEKKMEKLSYQNLTKGVSATSNYLFNNLKPSIPVVEKIIPLIVRDEKIEESLVEYRFRARIYFKTDTMDKNRRLGILVGEPKSVYKNLLKEFISRAGKDVVTSTSLDSLNLPDDVLTATKINYSGEFLEPTYKEDFNPIDDLVTGSSVGEEIGLVSYTPNYDIEQELWYTDIELKIADNPVNDLHTTFVQLGLVNYQPNSANYAMLPGGIPDDNQAFSADYRLSQAVKADFFSIRPKRSFKNPIVLFKHKRTEKFSLSGSIRSLYFEENEEENKRTLKSDFILCVKERGHGNFTNVVPSKLYQKSYRIGKQEITGYTEEPEQRYHLLLQDMEKSISVFDTEFEASFRIDFDKKLFGNHIVIIHEIECFNKMNIQNLQFLLVEHDIQNIDGIRILDNFIFER